MLIAFTFFFLKKKKVFSFGKFVDGTQQDTFFARPDGTFPSLLFLLRLTVWLELLQTC